VQVIPVCKESGNNRIVDRPSRRKYAMMVLRDLNVYVPFDGRYGERQTKGEIMPAVFTPEEIEKALKTSLPGYDAQRRMSPSHREMSPPAGKDTPFRGAVLLLLYPGNEQGELFVVLTVRTENVKFHKGQISLPGGGSEPQDVSLVRTALRETCEELGVCTEDVHVMGALTPLYIEPSNFFVHPFVARMPYRPSFVLEASEVLEVLEVPVSHFLDESNVAVEDRFMEGRVRRIPYFDVYGHKVWGATAIILSEFTAVVQSLGAGAEPRP
jgi:8-oxo-dGTP pyrophosphatase MutT (NUDIX family)